MIICCYEICLLLTTDNNCYQSYLIVVGHDERESETPSHGGVYYVLLTQCPACYVGHLRCYSRATVPFTLFGTASVNERAHRPVVHLASDDVCRGKKSHPSFLGSPKILTLNEAKYH
jgi:hypothetical protein